MKTWKLILLPLLLLLTHCDIDPFQPGRPPYDGGIEDSDATPQDGSTIDGGKAY